jgi:hypothetical protein
MDSTWTGAPAQARRYELRFTHLFHPGRCFAFPCDAQGRVEVTRLTELGRRSYQQVRGRVGQELAAPTVVAVG